MLKRIITLLILLLFTASSSGVVIFAFECSKFEHSHFSLSNKVSCFDFQDEIFIHNISGQKGHCGCCQEEYSCNLDFITNTAGTSIDNECGISSVKVLSLDIDTNIVQDDIIKARILLSCYSVYFLYSDFNFYALKENNKHISIIFKPDSISLKIVKYIQSITSNTSSEDLPSIC
jgi:hypothetical protein